MDGWLVVVSLSALVSNVLIVALFLRALRPLVRAIAADSSADLVQLEAVNVRNKGFKVPKRRRTPPEQEVAFLDTQIRPLGL